MARSLEFDEEEMLEKAMNLFWEKGYNATSAQDIVSTLGINRSSLYNTFGDKYQLFKRALQLYQTKNNRAMNLLVRQTQDPKATLKNIFTSLASNGSGNTLAKGCFVVNTAIELAPHDREMQQIVNANMVFAEEIFLLLLERAQAAGQVAASTNVKALASSLANSVNGLRVAARANHDPKSVQDIINMAVSTIH